MSAVQWVVVVVIGLGLWVLWRRHRFPGGWAFAFSLKYESDREALASARQRAREVSRRAAETESAALARVRLQRSSGWWIMVEWYVVMNSLTRSGSCSLR